MSKRPIMSKFKKPTKKEIKRCAEIIVQFLKDDKTRERENELYLAITARLHKQALVEVTLSDFFGLDPF